MSTMTTPRPPDTAERMAAPPASSTSATTRVDELAPAPRRRSRRARMIARLREIVRPRPLQPEDVAAHLRRQRALGDALRERERALTVMHTTAASRMR